MWVLHCTASDSFGSRVTVCKSVITSFLSVLLILCVYVGADDGLRPDIDRAACFPRAGEPLVSAQAFTNFVMAFIKRLMDHMLNQVLVETLANSRWFQRFAVYTHKLTKEAADKSKCFNVFLLLYGHPAAPLRSLLIKCGPTSGKDHSNLLDEHVSSIMEKSKAFTSKVWLCVFMGRRARVHAAGILCFASARLLPGLPDESIPFDASSAYVSQ